MPIWSDLAVWQGPTVNCGDGDRITNEPGDRIVDHMYVVLHIAQGSYLGTIAWQKNPTARVSSHFVVAKDGRCAQLVDTSVRAWTQAQGNPYSISIEFEGFLPTALTAPQLEMAARILARAHAVHGIPLQVTDRVGTRGLGHHSMGAESGVNWGHDQCPGPNIKAQKPGIVALAQQLVNGDDMLTPDQEQMLKNLHDWAFDTARGLLAADPGTAHVATYKPNEWLKALYDRPPSPPAPVDVAALAEALRPVVAEEAERAVRRVLGTLDGANPAGG